MAEQITETNNWLAEELRLTAFPVHPIKLPVDGWWEKVVGTPPESQIIKKILNRPLELQEIGLIQNARLIQTFTPVRFDWQLKPFDPEANIDNDDVLSTSLFERVLDIFLPLMNRWFQEDCPTSHRLAFGATLMSISNSQVDAYRRLSDYLPIEIDPEGSKDLLYQINRPRNSKLTIPSLRINRLSKWQVIKLVIGLQIETQSFELPGLEQVACRSELDINTIPDFKGEFAHNELPLILEELVDLGKEIASKGDIP